MYACIQRNKKTKFKKYIVFIKILKNIFVLMNECFRLGDNQSSF